MVLSLSDTVPLHSIAILRGSFDLDSPEAKGDGALIINWKVHFNLSIEATTARV